MRSETTLLHFSDIFCLAVLSNLIALIMYSICNYCPYKSAVNFNVPLKHIFISKTVHSVNLMKVINNQIEWLDNENYTKNSFAVCYITKSLLSVNLFFPTLKVRWKIMWSQLTFTSNSENGEYSNEKKKKKNRKKEENRKWIIL